MTTTEAAECRPSRHGKAIRGLKAATSAVPQVRTRNQSSFDRRGSGRLSPRVIRHLLKDAHSHGHQRTRLNEKPQTWRWEIESKNVTGRPSMLWRACYRSSKCRPAWPVMQTEQVPQAISSSGLGQHMELTPAGRAESKRRSTLARRIPTRPQMIYRRRNWLNGT